MLRRNPSSRPSITGFAAIATCLFMSALPASAQRVSVTDLQNQIDSLQTMLDALQLQVNAGPGPGSITTTEILNNTVASIDIADNTVTSSDIQNNTVTSSDILNNTIQDFDIVDEAGADFSAGNQLIALTATDTAIRSVSISAPTSGRVIVNASGYFDFNTVAGVDVGRCSITDGATAVDFNQLIIAGERSGSDVDWMPFAGVRAYNVSSGTTTFRLVCDEFLGNVSVGDSALTAIFVSTNY